MRNGQRAGLLVHVHVFVLLLVGCASHAADPTVTTAPAAAPDAGDTAAAGIVPEGVLDLLRDLPSYPAPMQSLHRLAESMHVEASRCAGFEAEERAELSTFDALSQAHADRDQAVRALGPRMAEVQHAVVPALVDALKTCRENQRGTAADAALDALMQACFGQTRADYPVTGAGGSTAYGDPLRLPAPTAFHASDACTHAAAQADAAVTTTP